MPHNGGLSQVNFNVLQVGGDYPFLNHVKCGQGWNLVDNSGSPEPSSLDENGYPTAISNGGVYTRFYIPSQTDRPGDWKCRWTGGGAAAEIYTSFAGSDAIDGSKVGASGFFTCRPTTQELNLGIKAIDGTPITNLEFFHEDDEGLIDAGEVFGTRFKERLAEGGFGVLRFINWEQANTTMAATWADRKPVGYVFYHGSEFRSSIYAGETSSTGDDYTVAFSGFVLADKAKVIVKWNADSTGTEPTIDVEGTGAIAIRAPTGDELFLSQRPLLGKFAILVYDEDLNCFLKLGGDLSFGDTFLRNGAPPELMVRLANEIGAHPWFSLPYLSLDPLTDYAAGLSGYCRDNLDAGLVPRLEPSNEVWNSSGGFFATRYSWNKANAHWGVNQDHHNWYGKVLATMGEAVSVVYSDDRSRYRVICAVQTHGSTSASAPRLTSALHVADGGDAAKDWATDVAVANYWSTSYSAAEEDDAATEYAAASTDAEREAIAAAYVASGATGDGQFSIPSLVTIYASWKAYGEGHGVSRICGYEGGWSPDYVTGETDLNTLKEASKSVPALQSYTQTNYENFVSAGGEFPSCFQLAGDNNAWSVFDPDIYATPSPQWDAIVAFNSPPGLSEGAVPGYRMIRNIRGLSRLVFR